ncbi:MAG: LysM peptidoglycan-binding domain-containing protein [Aquificaceae bacterium]
MMKGILLLGISFSLALAAECKYYAIREGDTLQKIAKREGIGLDSLRLVNKNLDERKLRPGQKICIPTQRKQASRRKDYSVYTIRRGGKLDHVSKAIGVSLKDLERLNPELKGKWLQAGTQVKVPKEIAQARTSEEKKEEKYALYTVKRGGKLDHVSKAIGVSLKDLERLNPELKGKWLQAGTRVKIPKKEEVVSKREELAIVERNSSITLPSALSIEPPVEGKVSKVQKGIEIFAECSSPVRAVESGRVIYSGGDLQAYGNMVIVEHDSFISLYAYNETNFVKRGDRVDKGQVIAKVGRKNNSDECTLRFELRNKEGIPLDPTEYMRDIQ